MEPFQSNRVVLTWLSIYSPAEGSRLRRSGYVAFTIFVHMINLLELLDSGMFVYRFINVDMEAVGFAILQFTALFTVVYLAIVTYILRSKLVEIMDKFTVNYRLCKHMNKFIIHNRLI